MKAMQKWQKFPSKAEKEAVLDASILTACEQDPVIRRVLQCKHYWVEYDGNTSTNKEFAFAEDYCARCGVIRRNKDEAQILL